MLWRKITFLGTASGRMAAMAGPVTWVGVTLYKVFLVTQSTTNRATTTINTTPVLLPLSRNHHRPPPLSYASSIYLL